MKWQRDWLSYPQIIRLSGRLRDFVFIATAHRSCRQPPPHYYFQICIWGNRKRAFSIRSRKLTISVSTSSSAVSACPKAVVKVKSGGRVGETLFGGAGETEKSIPTTLESRKWAFNRNESIWCCKLLPAIIQDPKSSSAFTSATLCTYAMLGRRKTATE